jgi:hypothetical protein
MTGSSVFFIFNLFVENTTGDRERIRSKPSQQPRKYWADTKKILVNMVLKFQLSNNEF